MQLCLMESNCENIPNEKIILMLKILSKNYYTAMSIAVILGLHWQSLITVQ